MYLVRQEGSCRVRGADVALDQAVAVCKLDDQADVAAAQRERQAVVGPFAPLIAVRKRHGANLPGRLEGTVTELAEQGSIGDLEQAEMRHACLDFMRAFQVGRVM